MRTFVHNLVSSHQLLDAFDDNHIVNGSASKKWGPAYQKMLVQRGDFTVYDPNKTVWLGGVCSLFTADSERIRKGEVHFTSADAFYSWLEQWYPRLDQIHDAVGVPPRACKRLWYVVEDSLFGRRVARWSRISEQGATEAFYAVHEQYGKQAIEAWLRAMGYNGEIEIVYTSELDPQLDLLLNMAQRRGQRIKRSRRDWLKVNLMYTEHWLDVLGLQEGLICEPYHHLLPLTELPFDTTNVMQLGYLPYWSENGPTRLKPWEAVVHRAHWRTFQPDTYTPANLFFNTPNPFSYPLELQRQNALELLARIYPTE